MKNIYYLLVAFLLSTSSILAQNFEWEEQQSGVEITLRDVEFANSNVGWVIGDEGTILYTDNAGQLWSEQNSGTEEILRGLFVLDSQTAFVVGGINNKVMIKTSDAGQTWHSLDPNDDIAENQILAVNFWSTDIGWVVTADKIFKTSDGGESWELEEYVSAIDQVHNRAIISTSESTAFVASRRKRTGTLNPFADVFYRLEDNSSPWVQSSNSAFGSDDSGLFTIDFADNLTGFAGGSNGKLYKSSLSDSDLSGPWNVNIDLSATHPTIISGLSFPSATNGMFSHGYNPNNENFTLVYHTLNAGETWSNVPDTIPGLLTASLHAPEENVAWAVGSFGKIFSGVAMPVGIEEVNLSESILVYPNPFTDNLNIKTDGVLNAHLDYFLFDASGREVTNGKISANDSRQISIDVKQLKQGLYYLHCFDGSNSSVHKVIKK